MSNDPVRPPAVRPLDVEPPKPVQPSSRGRIALIVAASMAAGLVVAVALVAAPFIPARLSVLTGVVLLAFAFGWALLTVLSVRLSDQPQRWAAAPAVFLTVAGLIALLGPDTVVGHGFRWVWPPLLLVLVVWSITRARRRMPSRARRWMVYPLLAGLALSAIGGGYETVRESIDAAAYPMPGQLIDVGGHRLHLNCTGSGSPTVILEPGLGEVSSAMAWIAARRRPGQPGLRVRPRRARLERRCRRPQDAVQTATDLHTLLNQAHIPGPYVLAGHSFGGLYVLTFAARTPTRSPAWCCWTPPHPWWARHPPQIGRMTS